MRAARRDAIEGTMVEAPVYGSSAALSLPANHGYLSSHGLSVGRRLSSRGTMGNRKRFGILALCAIAGSTVALMAPRHASADVQGSVTVSYQDLQLSRPADVRVLYKRLERAAESVCVAASPYELERYAVFKHCVQVTVSDAVARVHSPGLQSSLAALNHAGSESTLTARARP